MNKPAHKTDTRNRINNMWFYRFVFIGKEKNEKRAYGYDAGTTRTYKYSFDLNPNWVNGRLESVNFNPHNAMFYPNAYINFNNNGYYTKHYYNGMERIASRLGDNNLSLSTHDPELQDRKWQLDSNIRHSITEITSYQFLEPGQEPDPDDPKPVFELPQVGLNNLIPNTSSVYYYHPNHLGSTAYVTDENATVQQGFLYAPFGEITNEYNSSFGSSVLPKYSFNAKELDDETGMYYYEARYYQPPVFISRDVLFEKKPWLTPYHYCSNNPVGRVDISGNWDIDVHAYSDRGKCGYAVFIVKDRKGNEVYRTVVKVVGAGGRIRNATNSDTPQGKYKILEYRKTGEGTRYNRDSYGPNDLLALNYEGEEGGGRNGIHVHGGRQEGKYEGRSDLANTYGCMRINDQDILDIQNITNKLEQDDPMETKGYLTLTDDLNTPINYSADRHDVAEDQFPKIKKIKIERTNFIKSNNYYNYVAPADKTRVSLPYITTNNE